MLVTLVVVARYLLRLLPIFRRRYRSGRRPRLPFAPVNRFVPTILTGLIVSWIVSG